MDSTDVLDLFLPPVREWFRKALGAPTEAQRRGWPAIRAGQHTLILAPTGSGKTLAAFLACLDSLWRQESLGRGVQVLYISPLKALNNDIYRNLQLPLQGIESIALARGEALPKIDVAVRTGDTPAAERQRLLRQPPHVLITTPESLHLLLTSRARETLRSVRYGIVDEIHSLCPNKRGVFLSLLLERLGALNPAGFVRIGLSATQRPLDEVARYLGGIDSGPERKPRPVTLVDAGLRKGLDLMVVSPVDHFAALPEKSVWPSIYRLLANEIDQHRSTIIFANNRRSVERLTANLNEPELAVSRPPETRPVRAHHGSVALEVRQQTERALKEGQVRAVVATASLELGIDMGTVDLVCQVESPGNVARGLQRVGRAGHLVGQQSKGRLIPKTQADLLEQAVLAAEMAAGRVEALRVPVNCLDVLAQQIVAMVAMETWDVPTLYALVRRAYPFRDLTAQAFEAVLEMATGRYQFRPEPTDGDAIPAPPAAALQARISWDRTHNRLHALPGSQQLALLNGGTIPDTGQYAVYTRKHLRIGELDEEFIYERRIGDTFLLGTNAWRLEQIEADRVLVEPAAGAPAMVPFWHGEQAGRSYDLGLAIGKFLRELSARLSGEWSVEREAQSAEQSALRAPLSALHSPLAAPDDTHCIAWLEREYFLDTAAARSLISYVRRQFQRDCLPTDRRLVIEAARDQLGDWQVVLLSPLGGRLNYSLRLAIENALRGRLGYTPQCLHHDDGILIRLADADEPVLDVLAGLTPENVKDLLLDELADSALFALRFRQNAARALLMPRARAGKRAPLWLQRLRGRDLLQVARRHADFPIVAETFRECLHDHLDVPRLQQLLADIRAGAVEVVTRRLEAPSPFAAGLLFAFTAASMYQGDNVEAEPSGAFARLDRDLLDQLTGAEQQSHLLDPRAVHQVEQRLRGLGRPPRTSTEMAEWLRRLGDLAPGELEGAMAGFLQELEADGRARRIDLPDSRQPQRWVLAENAELYECTFGQTTASPEARQTAGEKILFRFLETHALVGLSDILDRYPFEPGWAKRKLEEWTSTGRVVSLPASNEAEAPQWSAPENLEQVQRGSLAILRREIMTCPAPQFADFVLRWQGVLREGADSDSTSEHLDEVLQRLQALLLPAELWEQTVLPARLAGYQPSWLDRLIGSGQWTWFCRGEGDAANLAFIARENISHMPPPACTGPTDSVAERALDILQQRGAQFTGDLAQATGLPPSTVRTGLWDLLRCQLLTNDSFDVIRERVGRIVYPSSDSEQRGGRRRRHGRMDHPSYARPTLSAVMRPHAAQRRRGVNRPEGRWSLLPWSRPDVEAQAVFLARVLLRRYGIISRELAQMDVLLPPWRILYEVLSRLELSGEVRRGYFVEGLSGAQFALPDAARLLHDLSLPSTAAAPIRLVHSLDPANLYGAGAPFDIPLLDNGSRPFLRRSGNWLVMRAGRPLLIIENHGRRLTALAAAQDEIAAAVACLPDILDRDRGLEGRHKLVVEEWNGAPVTGTAGGPLLEAAGFVRDYQSMTLYAAWR